MIRIPLFMLMRIQIQIPLRIRIQTCLASERKLFSSKPSLILRVGNLLIPLLLICPFAQSQMAEIIWATVSNLLRLIRTNEWLWMNSSGRSCRSCKKSNREWIPQVAHNKWATVSNFLRRLMINERMSKLLFFSEQIVHLLFSSQKTSDSLNKIWLKCFFGTFFVGFLKKGSDLLISSFLMCDVSKLLRLLTKNEWPWVIRSGHSPKMSKLQG